MCGKHVAERPRRKIRAALLVTACVLAVEFAFLTWLYHFDDGAQERSQATARASVALAGWQPGEDPVPVVRGARGAGRQWGRGRGPAAHPDLPMDRER